MNYPKLIKEASSKENPQVELQQLVFGLLNEGEEKHRILDELRGTHVHAAHL
jgi:hypothetical protein